MAEYKLPYTAEEIDEKLGKIGDWVDLAEYGLTSEMVTEWTDNGTIEIPLTDEQTAELTEKVKAESFPGFVRKEDILQTGLYLDARYVKVAKLENEESVMINTLCAPGNTGQIVHDIFAIDSNKLTIIRVTTLS